MTLEQDYNSQPVQSLTNRYNNLFKHLKTIQSLT